MSFGNPSELFLLARICFVRLMVFSVSVCLVFIASTECKIGLLPSMAIHISVMTCDQKLEPGKAWERGYHPTLFISSPGTEVDGLTHTRTIRVSRWMNSNTLVSHSSPQPSWSHPQALLLTMLPPTHNLHGCTAKAGGSRMSFQTGRQIQPTTLPSLLQSWSTTTHGNLKVS